MKYYTSTLLSHKIWYRWGFLFKLSFSYNSHSQSHTLTSLDKAQTILESLHLLPPSAGNQNPAIPASYKPSTNLPSRTWETGEIAPFLKLHLRLTPHFLTWDELRNRKSCFLFLGFPGLCFLHIIHCE